MDENGDSIKLSVFNQQTPSSVFFRVQTLFKIRRKMLKDIETSGNHDSDPWHFVDNALKQVKSTEQFGRIESVYFFINCEMNPDVDASFQPFLSEKSKGSSNVSLIEHSKPLSKKEKTLEYMEQSVQTGKTMLEYLKQNNEIRKDERDIRKEECDMKKQELTLKRKRHLQEAMNQTMQNYINPSCPPEIQDSLLDQWKSMDAEYKSIGH